MGDSAEMILEGIMCEGCGEFLDGDGPGFPRRCHACGGSDDTDPLGFERPRRAPRENKPHACTCGSRFRETAHMDQHRRDKGCP